MWPQGINAPSTYLGRSKTPVLLPRGSASDKGNLDSRRTSQLLHGRLQTSDSFALLKFRYLTRLKQIGNDKSRSIFAMCTAQKAPLSPLVLLFHNFQLPSLKPCTKMLDRDQCSLFMLLPRPSPRFVKSLGDTIYKSLWCELHRLARVFSNL
jgi:hypothetical protein